MRTERFEKIAEFVVKGVGIAIPILALSWIEKKQNNETYVTDVNELFGSIYYDDAAASIMNSDMLDSRKVEVLKMLKRNQPEYYYKTVITIIKSNMLDSRKIEAIKSL